MPVDKRITYRYGVLTLLRCPMQFALWHKERRIHTCCALVVNIALLMGGFFPQNHKRTIVCSTTTLCKALRVIIVFRSKSLASALFACFCVQRKSVRGLKNDVYTRGVCLLRAVHLALWFLSQNYFSKSLAIGLSLSRTDTKRDGSCPSVSDGVDPPTFYILCKRFSVFF